MYLILIFFKVKQAAESVSALEALSPEELQAIEAEKAEHATTLAEYSNYTLPFFFPNVNSIACSSEVKADFVWVGNPSGSEKYKFIGTYSNLLYTTGM